MYLYFWVTTLISWIPFLRFPIKVLIISENSEHSLFSLHNKKSHNFSLPILAENAVQYTVLCVCPTACVHQEFLPFIEKRILGYVANVVSLKL